MVLTSIPNCTALKEFRASLVADSENLLSDNKAAKIPRDAALALKDKHAFKLDWVPNHNVTRQEILDLAVNQELPTSELCLTILAWGGCNIRHIEKLYQSSSDWINLAQEIRSGELTRQESYRGFAKLRRANNLPGVGPAYFTKLIYFLMPRQDTTNPIGYIMDQWLACSINLLLGQPVVTTNFSHTWGQKNQLRPSFQVSDANTPETYEAFCLAVETVADAIEYSAEETERLLMSKGGKSPKSWRKYVVNNRLPQL